MTAPLAFGPPVSWRTRTNTAALHTFAAGKTSQVRTTTAWQPTFTTPAPGSGLLYDTDALGRAPAMTRVTAELDYLLRADAGLAGSAAQQSVEDKLSALYAALSCDYTDTSDGNTYSGNVGWLRAWNAGGSQMYDALARILTLPYHTTPGANVYGLQTTLSWQLLSDWQVAGAGADAGAPTPVGPAPALPLGQVLFWKDAANAASPLLVFPAGRTTMLRGEVSWRAAFGKPPPGRRYETDNLGVTGASQQHEPEFDYLLKAAPGLSGALATASVETQASTLLDALQDNSTTQSGSLGTLVVNSSDGTRSYQALCRLLALPLPMSPKTQYGLVVTLKAHLLEPFTLVPTTARYGAAIYGTSRYG